MTTYPQHTVHSFSAELSRIHSRVHDMGNLVVEQLEKLLVAIRNRDSAVAYGITRRETRVNQMEVEADTEIFTLLATRCPVAKDLRSVMAASKIVTHLERVGDEIAKIANVLLEDFQSDPDDGNEATRETLLSSCRQTLEILGETLNAFYTLDFPAAKSLAAKKKMPRAELNDDIRRLLGAVETEPQPIRASVSQILILKALDRVKELALEIADDISFLTKIGEEGNSSEDPNHSSQ